MKSMPLLRYPSCAELAGGAPHRIHPPKSIHREEILPRSDGINVNEEQNVNMTGTMEELKIEMNGLKW